MGFARRVGARLRDVLGFDVGVWHGITDDNPAGETTTFTWPMAGLSYHYAI